MDKLLPGTSPGVTQLTLPGLEVFVQILARRKRKKAWKKKTGWVQLILNLEEK